MKPLIIANWKMNRGIADSAALAENYRVAAEPALTDAIDIVICPPLLALDRVGSVIADSEIALGAQDVFWQEKGAYTGEIAASTLSEIGCRYAIIGHSERRTNLGETDEMVNRKVQAALRAGVFPVICVGENFDERQSGLADAVIMRQIIDGLKGITLKPDDHIVVAYEPVWVIGTGQAIDPAAADHAAHLIQQALMDVLSPEIVQNQTRVIYGGSVDATNMASFLESPMISGALVGSASLNAELFFSACKTLL